MKINEISNIGSKIRKERRTRGFSQSELSKKLDISASYLNLLESGRRTITVPLLIKVGNELGLSLKDLFEIPVSPSCKITLMAALINCCRRMPRIPFFGIVVSSIQKMVNFYCRCQQ